MDARPLIHDAARSIASLAEPMIGIEQCGDEREHTLRAVERGYFAPEEDEAVRAWFARYLTMRACLLETVNELAPIAKARNVDPSDRLRAFLVGYTAVCLLVRAARFLVDDFAQDPLVRGKLNEADPTRRVPRKQYAAIHRSLTSPRHAWRLLDARRYADAHRAELDALEVEPDLAPVVQALGRVDRALDVHPARYGLARFSYRWQGWRRRRASAAQRSLFALLEMSGRAIAEARPSWQPPRVSGEAREQLCALLRPGDVIVTRYEHALSNLFLPGFWPHVALYIGPGEEVERRHLDVEPDRAKRWCDGRRVLEARKDGVLFRAIDDTLSVDAVAVIRPRLELEQIMEAIVRAVRHEGKLYNFDFDFSRADRLVCTEVVYRAYDGISTIEMPLSRRAGRFTLSAEDLIDLALAGRGFDPVALFGAPNVGNRVVTGNEAADALATLKSENAETPKRRNQERA